jgi:hypothetical protein
MAVRGGPETDRTMTDVLARALDNPILPTIGLAVGLTVLALWLAAAWWAYRDAARRAGSSFAGMLAAAWVVLSSPLLLPLSVAIYTLARPQHTAAELRSRHLIRELIDELDASTAPRCRACGTDIDVAWLRCPACATWLAEPCSRCGSWSDPALDICPWCGGTNRAEPVVEGLQPSPAAPAPEPAAPGRAAFARKRRDRQAQRAGAAAGAERDVREPRRGVAALAETRVPMHARAR